MHSDLLTCQLRLMDGCDTMYVVLYLAGLDLLLYTSFAKRIIHKLRCSNTLTFLNKSIYNRLLYCSPESTS